ncbi:MAG: hypothetical protein AVO38_05545 [delta proteobacterium ML8_D]|nr:MAG: hypothetical protein AVO38_05545 [delta proteobacterium ML8_D]
MGSRITAAPQRSGGRYSINWYRIMKSLREKQPESSELLSLAFQGNCKKTKFSASQLSPRASRSDTTAPLNTRLRSTFKDRQSFIDRHLQQSELFLILTGTQLQCLI